MKQILLSLSLTAFCFLNCLAVPFPYPLPQGGNGESGESDERSTDLCEEFKFDEFMGDLVTCFATANSVVDEVLAGDGGVVEIKRAICQVRVGLISSNIYNSIFEF